MQTNENDYKFPRDFYNALPEFRSQEFQDKMVENIIASVAQTRREIREKVYHTFHLVDPELSARVKRGVEKMDASFKQVSLSRL